MKKFLSSPGCSGRLWALPAFCSVGTGEFFHWVYNHGSMRLITPLCQDLWLKIRGALLSLPTKAFMPWCVTNQGEKFPVNVLGCGIGGQLDSEIYFTYEIFRDLP